MRYENTDKDRLINEIVDIEFAMFDKVNSLTGRAPCQNDERTFYIMRYSQHNAFSEMTLLSYRKDLNDAKMQGRNMITEKYGYMMEFTDKLYYENMLKSSLPSVSKQKLDLIEQILEIQEQDFKEFEEKYPYFASSGRPKTIKNSVATVRVYTIGELKTYSYETLLLYKNDLISSREQGMSTVMKIHLQTAIFYGYKNIEDAEQSIKMRLNKS